MHGYKWPINCTQRKEKQIALLEEQFLASQQKRDSWLQDIQLKTTGACTINRPLLTMRD